MKILTSLSTLSIAVLVCAGIYPAANAVSNSPSETSIAAEAPLDFSSLPHVSRVLTQSPEQLLEAYWTPERMKAAVTNDYSVEDYHSGKVVLPIGGTSDKAVKEENIVSPSLPAFHDGRVSTTARDAAFSTTVGKVFFRNTSTGKDSSCSGAVVNSDSKRLVMTAGHCIHGGNKGTWHTNWIFVPDYHDGLRPFGVFPARTFRTTPEWIKYGATAQGFQNDYGFVTTHDGSQGGQLANIVGGNGIRIGGASFQAHILAYPGNKQNGQYMWRCDGRTSPYLYNGRMFHRINGCDFGPGSSGAPWLDDYKNGVGYIRSVTSFGPKNSTEYSGGAYFGSKVMEMYGDTKND